MKILFFIPIFLFQVCDAASIDSLLNIKYGEAVAATSKRQVLSLSMYFPQKESGKKYPLVMLMHGGGFTSGSKDAMKAHCRILADSGFIAVTIDYRKGWDAGATPLACEGKMEELQLAVYRATQDAHAAVRYLVHQQKEYAIDTSWIFVGGSSAGAVLALNLVYLNDAVIKVGMPGAYETLGKLDKSTNDYEDTYTIKGICNMWGALPDSSVITRSNAVPAILFHGNADYVVPYDVGRFGTVCNNYPLMFGSACIYRQTMAAGKAVVLNRSIGGGHGPKEFNSKLTMSNTACFFRKVMAGEAASNYYSDVKMGCRN